LTKARSPQRAPRELRHIPMPRMTNTYMLAGNSDPAEIIRSVKKGLYAGQFLRRAGRYHQRKICFLASERLLIEDGRLTRPVRNAYSDRRRPHGPQARFHGRQ